MSMNLLEQKNLELLDRYDKLNLYEYKRKRKEEKAKKSKSKGITDSKYPFIRETVWNYLLDNFDTGYNSYQAFATYKYLPKPNPSDVDTNDAYITILESQRRFLQNKEESFIEGSVLQHLDLNSAYLTALSNIKDSLKFNTSYKLNEINDLRFDFQNNPIHHYLVEDLFNIIKVTCTMPYDSKINLFAPNNKIMYNGKEVSPSNVPQIGDTVAVRFELFVSQKYNLDAWVTWQEIFKDWDITYKRVTVYTYDYIQRRQMFNIEDVKNLLDEMKLLSKSEKVMYKQAIVSFTGQLINIDPGRRLIMIASMEEVMRRIYTFLSRRTTVVGTQIDGIKFESYEWEDDESPVDIAWHFGKKVYNLDDSVYSADRFSKLETLYASDYKETTFRIQGVKKK